MNTYVYIVWEEGTPFYKIGVTKNVEERFKNYLCHNPHELVLLHKIRAISSASAFSAERAVAVKYAKHKVRRNNEWYEMTLGEVRNVAKLLAAKANSAIMTPRMKYRNITMSEPVFDKFRASKAKYGKKVGLDGTVTEFMTLMIDIWDSNQAIVDAVEGGGVC